MKKKLFAIYALIGALVASPVFTSCVDDEESPSVTAIRDAKTAELKSIAALKKAEAQAEATLAAAQVALKAAEAEAQVAAAKLSEAETALKETQNEAAAAALLVQKKEAEQRLAEIQAEMEKQEVIIEAALLDAQADLLNAKKQLDKATKNYDASQKAELQSLATAYYTAVNELLNAKKSLINLETQLASYETGFADAKEGLQETVANYNNNIEYYKIKIAQYKQYTNYTEDIDALKLEQIKAVSANDLATDKLNAAWTNYWDAQNDVDNEKLNELYQAIQDDAYFRFAEYREFYDAEAEEYVHFNSYSMDFSIAVERDENFDCIHNDYNQYSVSYKYLDNETYLGDSISFEFEYLRDIRKTELVFAQYMDPMKDNIKAAEEAIKADKTALTTAETAATAAKKAWDEAAEADKAAKEGEYRTALAEVVRLQDAIKSNEDAIKVWNKDLTIWTGALDMLKNMETLDAALQEKIKAYNDAVKEEYAPVVEAWKAQIDAEIVQTETCAALEVINELLNGGSVQGAESIADNIKNYENNIEYYQERIEEAEKLLASYWSYGEQMSYEDVIAWYKAQVEAQKAVVAAKEVAVAGAKAALDAAMPAEE